MKKVPTTTESTCNSERHIIEQIKTMPLQKYPGESS